MKFFSNDDSATAVNAQYAQSMEEGNPLKSDQEKIPKSEDATPINSEEEEEDASFNQLNDLLTHTHSLVHSLTRNQLKDFMCDHL